MTNGREPLSYMALKVDAFVTAITTSGDGRPAPAELVVHVDYDTLRGEVTAAGLCETVDGVELPAATVRRSGV